MSQPTPPLTYSDVVQAVTAALAPMQRQLDAVEKRFDTLGATVDKLRDERNAQVTRDEVLRLTANFQIKDLAEQRYNEMKAVTTDLETRFASLEAKQEALQQRGWQSWQTLALLLGGWLFVVLFNVLMKVLP